MNLTAGSLDKLQYHHSYILPATISHPCPQICSDPIQDKVHVPIALLLYNLPHTRLEILEPPQYL